MLGHHLALRLYGQVTYPLYGYCKFPHAAPPIVFLLPQDECTVDTALTMSVYIIYDPQIAKTSAFSYEFSLLIG